MTQSPPSNSRLRRFAVRAALAVGVLLLMHPLILRWATVPIARSDQPVEASHLLFLRSARLSASAHEFAARFATEQVGRTVLVLQDFVRRSEAIGASPPFVECTIAELVAKGVPRDRIEILSQPDAITYGELIGHAGRWLSQRPTNDRLLVVTHSFQTGYLMDVARQAVPSETRQRMHIVGFDRLGVTKANWWKSATGVKYFLEDWIHMLHFWCWGEFQPEVTWDPDEYEAELRSGTP